MIYYYRGLFSGATLEPADKVFLIAERENKNIAGFENVDTGEKVYYRGFIYQIKKRVNLSSGFYLLIGEPCMTDCTEGIIYPSDFVSKGEVDRFLDWKMKKGLKVN